MAFCYEALSLTALDVPESQSHMLGALALILLHSNQADPAEAWPA